MSIGNFLLWVNKKIHWVKMVGDPSSPTGDKMVIVSIWKEGKGGNQELLSSVEEVEADALGYYR